MRVVLGDRAIDCRCVSDLVAGDTCPACGEALISKTMGIYVSVFGRHMCVDAKTYKCGTFAILLGKPYSSADRPGALIHEGDGCKSNVAIAKIIDYKEDVI